MRYAEAVESICECMRRGEVRQVNVATRLTSEAVVDRDALYHQPLAIQQPSYGAMIDVGALTIMNASPEFFFDWHFSSPRCRPMKGTRRRGRFAEEDVAFTQDLVTDLDERVAELEYAVRIRLRLSRGAELRIDVDDALRHDDVSRSLRSTTSSVLARR